MGETRRIPVADEVQLHVEIDGEGPHLVTLNGAFCTVRQWDRAASALNEKFTVVRIELRGLGKSSAGPADRYRFEQNADDVMAVLDSLGVSTASLWGTAWGARVALVTAARNPDRFTRVVLGDLAIDPADPSAQKAGAAAAKLARAAAGLSEVDRPPGLGDHADRDEAAKAIAATQLHPDLAPFVERLTVPTLVVTGEFDPNLVSSRRAVHKLVNGRLVVPKLVGHAALLQRPDAILEAVLPFLTADGENAEPQRP